MPPGKFYQVRNAPLLKDIRLLYLRGMVKPKFHLHLDAAYLPAPLLERMLLEGGFHLDDFPHELMLEGKPVSARHLTKYLYAPTSSHQARAECVKLKAWAQEFGFKGLIQCEYVMEESEWSMKDSAPGELLPPFEIRTRPLSQKKGDQFKKHEVHLELSKVKTSVAVVQALRGCGLHVLENETTITFTTAGPTKEMLTLREALRVFLADHEKEMTGKLTYEATAFWSLHGIESETLPKILDQIIPFNGVTPSGPTPRLSPVEVNFSSL